MNIAYNHNIMHDLHHLEFLISYFIFFPHMNIRFLFIQKQMERIHCIQNQHANKTGSKDFNAFHGNQEQRVVEYLCKCLDYSSQDLVHQQRVQPTVDSLLIKEVTILKDITLQCWELLENASLMGEGGVFIGVPRSVRVRLTC